VPSTGPASYSSWETRPRSEFALGQSHAYRLLDAARVVEALPEGHSAVGERVARELVPVLREAPEQVPEVYDNVRQPPRRSAHGRPGPRGRQDHAGAT
jgi:hypothetical protein